MESAMMSAPAIRYLSGSSPTGSSHHGRRGRPPLPFGMMLCRTRLPHPTFRADHRKWDARSAHASQESPSEKTTVALASVSSSGELSWGCHADTSHNRQKLRSSRNANEQADLAPHERVYEPLGDS